MRVSPGAARGRLRLGSRETHLRPELHVGVAVGLALSPPSPPPPPLGGRACLVYMNVQVFAEYRRMGLVYPM